MYFKTFGNIDNKFLTFAQINFGSFAVFFEKTSPRKSTEDVRLSGALSFICDKNYLFSYFSRNLSPQP